MEHLSKFLYVKQLENQESYLRAPISLKLLDGNGNPVDELTDGGLVRLDSGTKISMTLTNHSETRLFVV